MLQRQTIVVARGRLRQLDQPAAMQAQQPDPGAHQLRFAFGVAPIQASTHAPGDLRPVGRIGQGDLTADRRQVRLTQRPPTDSLPRCLPHRPLPVPGFDGGISSSFRSCVQPHGCPASEDVGNDVGRSTATRVQHGARTIGLIRARSGDVDSGGCRPAGALRRRRPDVQVDLAQGQRQTQVGQLELIVDGLVQRRLPLPVGHRVMQKADLG